MAAILDDDDLAWLRELEKPGSVIPIDVDTVTRLLRIIGKLSAVIVAVGDKVEELEHELTEASSARANGDNPQL